MQRGGGGQVERSGILVEDFLHKSVVSGELFGKLVRE